MSSSFPYPLLFRKFWKNKKSHSGPHISPPPPARVRVHDLLLTPLSLRPGWSSALYRRPLDGYHALDTMHSLMAILEACDWRIVLMGVVCERLADWVCSGRVGVHAPTHRLPLVAVACGGQVEGGCSPFPPPPSPGPSRWVGQGDHTPRLHI